ncbi:mitotic checkpoint regulator, MAD2B-interacting-domain-containing protein [Phycomyces nitens]|nr:mitotic checkpoint regulator, MAD2B-interacting-domain-containing protein [Phycomyces nitens]
MSLVADYGSSDSEESDVETTVVPKKTSSFASLLPLPKKKPTTSSFASLLPDPKQTAAEKPVFYVEVPVNKKDLEEDEESNKRSKRLKTSGTVDFADLLPAPKNTALFKSIVPVTKKTTDASLMPLALARKQKAAQEKAAKEKAAKEKADAERLLKSIPKVNAAPDEEEEEEEIKHTGSFFPLGPEVSKIPAYTLPTPKKPVVAHTEAKESASETKTDLDPKVEAVTATAVDAYAYTYDPNAMYAYGTDPSAYYQQHYSEGNQYDQSYNAVVGGHGASVGSNDDDVDPDELGRLAGKRFKGQDSGIQFKTINQADMLPTEEWRLAALASTPKFNNDGPAITATTAQKKRNNIMALAAQAVEMQEKLSEQYAENRRTKRETKNKYGF